MNFFVVLGAWFLLAAVLVVGLVLATKGTFWLLILSLAVFVFAFSKWGCATHD